METQACPPLGPNVCAGTGVYLSPGCRICTDGPVVIGDNVICGPGVTICAEAERGVLIGTRVWLGEGVEVRPGAKIGPGTLVCAGSVVEGELPANAVVQGSPARVSWYLR